MAERLSDAEREQIRQDAAEELSGHSRHGVFASAQRLARHCRALDAEVDAVKKERNERTPHWGVDRDHHESVVAELEAELDRLRGAS